MLPVVAGDRETRKQILIYTLLLAGAGLAPWLMGFASWIYLAAAMIGGVAMIAIAVAMWRQRLAPAQPDAVKTAWRMFSVSIFYLFGVFAALLVERAIGL
jgi:protoheme IX farnesyltransferase